MIDSRTRQQCEFATSGYKVELPHDVHLALLSIQNQPRPKGTRKPTLQDLILDALRRDLHNKDILK